MSLILDKKHYSTIITKFIKINLKLKNDLPKLVSHEYRYKHFLQKIHNFATLIDLGYENIEMQKKLFDNIYISLNQLYDLLMLNDEDDYTQIKKIILDASMYDMVELVDVNYPILSWKDLFKIINKNVCITCIHEKNFIKYVYKEYNACIIDILQEIDE